MKFIKFLLFLLFFTQSFAAKAEDWVTLSLVELIYSADTIVEGHFIKKAYGYHIFSINGLNQASKNDILYLSKLDNLFKDNSGFSNEGKFMLFLSYNAEKELEPVWSGFRLLKDDFIYMPVQRDNPGKFSFEKTRDSIKWEDFVWRVQKINSRMQEIKQIKKDYRTKLRAQNSLRWLEKNKAGFGKKSGLNDDCGWGSIEWEIFDWISKGKIFRDIWKASQIYREVNSNSEYEWRKNDRILNSSLDIISITYDDIGFLINISLDTNCNIYDRQQALRYLTEASYKVYENNYTTPDSMTLTLQYKNQKAIRNFILPLLGNEYLKEEAFKVVSAMSNPIYGQLNHRIDLEALPLIKEYYKKESYGVYKSLLYEFIFDNSTVVEWKEFSGCDAKILINLNAICIDSSAKLLYFHIKSNGGREYSNEAIPGKPTYHIISENTNTKIESKEYSGLELLFSSPYQGTTLNIDISNLTKGKYRVYITGTAGENSQYEWRSDYGPFEVK